MVQKDGGPCTHGTMVEHDKDQKYHNQDGLLPQTDTKIERAVLDNEITKAKHKSQNSDDSNIRQCLLTDIRQFNDNRKCARKENNDCSKMQTPHIAKTMKQWCIPDQTILHQRQEYHFMKAS